MDKLSETALIIGAFFSMLSAFLLACVKMCQTNGSLIHLKSPCCNCDTTLDFRKSETRLKEIELLAIRSESGTVDKGMI